MRIYVDFSIFTKEPSAFGNAHGTITVAATPLVGDAILFVNARPGARMPECGGSPNLIVENRTFFANDENGEVKLSLADLTVPTVADARAMAEYLEVGFGLYVDAYDDVPKE